MLKPIIVFTVAAVPAVIWLWLFLQKRNLPKWLAAGAFIGGMAAAKAIMIYQGYWGDTINIVFFKIDPVDFRSNIYAILGTSTALALFLSFVGVGVMEEYAKFWMMRFIGHNFFKSIDDVIELAVITALGFAFFENMIYFGDQWGKIGGVGSFFAFALMRVTVVTMVHMLSSGVVGYYYGMAFFASPMLKIHYMKKKRHPALFFLKKIFHMRRSGIYHDEMMGMGLAAAFVIHALYDFLLSVEIGFMAAPVMFAYFFGGFWFLNYLLKQKDLNLKLGLVGTSVMPKEDFVKLLAEIQEIKEKMAKTA